MSHSVPRDGVFLTHTHIHPSEEIFVDGEASDDEVDGEEEEEEEEEENEQVIDIAGEDRGRVAQRALLRLPLSSRSPSCSHHPGSNARHGRWNSIKDNKGIQWNRPGGSAEALERWSDSNQTCGRRGRGRGGRGEW